MGHTRRNPDGTIEKVWEAIFESGRRPRVTIRWADVDGRLEVVNVEIGARFDRPTERDPVPITTSVLRSLALKRMVDHSRRRNIEMLTDLVRPGSRISGRPLGRARRAEARRNLELARKGAPPRPGRPTLYGREHFAQVAETYTTAHAVGRDPRLAVADRWRVSASTAARWISRARHQYHLLPKTKRGRAKGRRDD